MNTERFLSPTFLKSLLIIYEELRRSGNIPPFLAFSFQNARSHFQKCSSSQTLVLQKRGGEYAYHHAREGQECKNGLKILSWCPGTVAKAARFFFPPPDCNGVARCYALGSGPTNCSVPSGVHFAVGRMHPSEVAGVTEAPVSLTLIPCQQLRFIYIHACFPGTRPAASAGPPASL